MSAPRPLGAVFLGAVRHAGSYLPILAAQPGVTIRAIAEVPDARVWARDNADRLGDRFGIPVRADVDALLADPDVDLVVVCSEPVRHAALAARALAAGKHVLVDKPMAVSPEEAAGLVAVARTAPGRFTFVHRLFSPAIQRARAAIDAGHLGLVRSVDIEWLASDGLAGETVERADLVADPALSGGGELMNFLGYPIGYLRDLTGAEVVEVYAETASFFFAPHRRHGVEDFGLLSLQLDHGIVATIAVGRVPQGAGPGAVSSTLRLIGSHGRLTIDESQPTLDRWTPTERRVRTIGGDAGTRAVTAVITEFLRDIREERVPRAGARDGWAIAVAIDAAYRSAACGQPVATRRDDAAIANG